MILVLLIGILLGGVKEKYTLVSRGLNKQPRTGGMGKMEYLLRAIDRYYVDTVDIDSLTEGIIPVLLEKLDPHTTYIPAKDLAEANEELSGNFGGIGVQFRIFNDTVMVMHVIKGGPSQKLGIKEGDRLIAVNDSVIAGVGFKNENVMETLRGERGTKVKVTAFRPSEKRTIDFDIERDGIPVESVAVAYMMNAQTGYINIERFGQNTYREFLLALTQLKNEGCLALVVDLRGNMGGYLGAVVSMVNEFLERGEMIVYTDGKAQQRQEYKADGSGTCPHMRLAVLLDERSASASEIFAGAIQDNDRGIIIGRRSFGKGLVQNQQMLPDGSALRLTVARYYTPAGRCIQKDYENGAESYAHDLWQRYLHGEMDTKDSISFKNAKSFQTKSGRMVYDSGGVMPDVFIPRDTSGITPFFKEVANKDLVQRYAFFYVDKHRRELSDIAQAGGIADLYAYLKEQNLFPSFLALCKAEGLEPSVHELEASHRMLEVQMYAAVAQNVMDKQGFFPVIKDIDNTVLEAERIMALPGFEFYAKMVGE